MRIIIFSFFPLIICSCVRYHTRIFQLNETSIYKKGLWYDVYGVECGLYLIHPDVWAYQGSSGVDIDSLYPFSVFIRINDTTTSDLQSAVSRIRENVLVDSLKLIFSSSKEGIWMVRTDEGVLQGEGNPGLYFYFGHLIIPAEIDSITLIMPVRPSVSVNVNLGNCDTLSFHMHRREHSSIGPPLH